MTARTDGLRLLREMRGDDAADAMAERAAAGGAQGALAGLALDVVFGEVWARSGLTRQQRSLVTIDILIALRQPGELARYLAIGLANGLSPAELEEAVVQAAPYSGFPAAWHAAELLNGVTSATPPDQT